jgi:predicted metal-dependent phosphoesterase TrpH
VIALRARLASASVGLFLVGIAVGSATDRFVDRPEIRRGGYRVLQGDFHVHTRFSDGFSSPLDIPFLAARQGLDVVGVTEHNNVFPGKMARAVSEAIGGPRVIVGEEITSNRFHMIAVGLDARIPAGFPVEEAAKRVHAQNGLAIAAHPVRPFWPMFDPALDTLDGAEVMHPIAYRGVERRGWRWHEMVEFYERARAAGHPLAAIGSSDYHFFKVLGACRTYIFAGDDSEAAVLDAIRAKRTVVFDLEGKPYGDPEMIALLDRDPLPDRGRFVAPGYESNGGLDAFGRFAGWLGLVGILFFGAPDLKIIRREGSREPASP